MNTPTQYRGLNPKAILLSILGVIALIIMFFASKTIFENVDAGEIVIIQDPIDGDLHFYTAQGMKFQKFGKVTKYQKSFQYWFSVATDQGKKLDQSIKIRYNDGGHAQISGSVRCDLPMDNEHLTLIHTKLGSQVALEHELVRPVYEKAIYMTGPLMSSKESYAEKRNMMISYIEDQANLGVYKTVSKEVKGIDPITDVEKTVTQVELVKADNAPGKIAREEISPLQTFGVKAYNLSINSITYDGTVEAQISSQQKAIMEVQTAMAEAKKAEQRAITVTKEGEANAAKSKWEQEVIKAKMVTEAQQKLEVAELDRKAAEQTKQQQILLGQGEAERKRLVMSADGALEKKLETYADVMKTFATEFAKQKWVPETLLMTGGESGGKQYSPVMDMMNMFMVKTARDLNLDMTIPAGRTVRSPSSTDTSEAKSVPASGSRPSSKK
ncbi:MAG: SPFH domain-containing protein [Nanoarchaeota archaeon]|nr:SPFH domain-containing protein [Nanoarchaeota archaeon]